MADPILTIAIPTYNRPEQLRRCLEALVPQLNDDCWLHIADNHSLVPASEIAESILGRHGFEQFSIVRQPFNKGAHYNLFHCYDIAHTRWLWVIGDDDVPSNDAVSKILEITESRSNLLAVVSEVSFFRAKIGGQSQLDQNFELTEYLASDAFFFSGLISALVINIGQVRAYMGIGYEYSSSYFPHVAILVEALQQVKKGEIRYINTPFVVYVADGEQEKPVSPILGNMRYLTRMLELDSNRKAFMANSYVRIFCKKYTEKIFTPSPWVVMTAIAFRETQAGKEVLRFVRRRTAESFEFDNIDGIIPIAGISMSLLHVCSILIGCIFAPFLRVLFFIKSKGCRAYPDILNQFRQPAIP